MSSTHSYQDNDELLIRAQQGDEEARELIYSANVGLIYMVLERFAVLPMTTKICFKWVPSGF